MAQDRHITSGRQRVLAALVARAEPDLRRLGASGVNVTLAAEDQLVQLAYSAVHLAREVYELQRTLGEGPTLDAVSRGVPIVVDLDEADDLWVAFGHEARALGIERIYAVPLAAGGARVGALTVHVGPPDPTRPGATRTGAAPSRATPPRPVDNPLSGVLRLADQLLLALLAPPNAPAEAADTGVFTTVTHQAAGMVSVQLDLPITDAVVTLQAEAYASGRDLVAVSRDVVTRRLRFDHNGSYRTTSPVAGDDPRAAGGDEETGSRDDR